MNLSTTNKGLLIALIYLFNVVIKAPLKFAAMFYNNMVLQRHKPVTIWRKQSPEMQLATDYTHLHELNTKKSMLISVIRGKKTMQ
jgi:hypothetical protein